MAFKLVILAALCVYVQAQSSSTTLTPTMAQKVNAVATKCKTELNSPPEAVALLGARSLPTDEKQRCFLECVYKNLGIVKDNKFSPEGSKALAAQRFKGDELTKANKLVETCAKEVVVAAGNTEKCALGKSVRSCFVKNGEKIPNFFRKA
ncbi:hypothetical protein M8J77_003797 [Diaphorina citri]|nr:hypothetical protein M8J77_003797 [Diaphorina citri]